MNTLLVHRWTSAPATAAPAGPGTRLTTGTAATSRPSAPARNPQAPCTARRLSQLTIGLAVLALSRGLSGALARGRRGRRCVHGRGPSRGCGPRHRRAGGRPGTVGAGHGSDVRRGARSGRSRAAEPPAASARTTGHDAHLRSSSITARPDGPSWPACHHGDVVVRLVPWHRNATAPASCAVQRRLVSTSRRTVPIQFGAIKRAGHPVGHGRFWSSPTAFRGPATWFSDIQRGVPDRAGPLGTGSPRRRSARPRPITFRPAPYTATVHRLWLTSTHLLSDQLSGARGRAVAVVARMSEDRPAGYIPSRTPWPGTRRRPVDPLEAPRCGQHFSAGRLKAGSGRHAAPARGCHTLATPGNHACDRGFESSPPSQA